MTKLFQPKKKKHSGFTLVETVVAMAVLSFGVLALSAIYTQGLKASAQTQIQFIAQQKAQEALETLFTARDTKLLTWPQIANVSQGGVFKDGPQPLLAPGPDGLLGTADDDASNPNCIVVGPGPDNILGTSDDTIINLNPWMTRTIAITPDPNVPNLNDVTITINYSFQGQASQFVLRSYLSSFS
jgi:prepilin-type N-terminal cleavage/methylation domain-containing protein